jgi:hypothetical protein
MDQPELIPIGEARRMLRISPTTMARLVKEGRFTVYDNPLDRRQKLVDRREVLALAAPVLRAPNTALEPAGGARDDDAPALTDEGLRRALSLLAALANALREQPDTPFVLSGRSVVYHAGLPDGVLPVASEDIGRLRAENYVKVLPHVLHRVGGETGREFVLTELGEATLRRFRESLGSGNHGTGIGNRSLGAS